MAALQIQPEPNVQVTPAPNSEAANSQGERPPTYAELETQIALYAQCFSEAFDHTS